MLSGDLFKFIDMGTKLIEMETGYTENESVTYAVRKAIEHAVLQIIKQGEKENNNPLISFSRMKSVKFLVEETLLSQYSEGLFWDSITDLKPAKCTT